MSRPVEERCEFAAVADVDGIKVVSHALWSSVHTRRRSSIQGSATWEFEPPMEETPERAPLTL
jgi:hypothetical protein